jgi:catechol 2,3-dioxygenase-like lactoylglutathione lyase family enzyme
LLKRVNSIYLPARDPERSIKWYEGKLGLTRPLGQDSGILQLADGTWLFLEKSIGRTTSNFATSGWTEKGNFEMFSICFEVDNAKQLYEKLRKEGVEVEELQDEGRCGLQFIFYDIDGNKFQIFQQPQ